MSRYLPRTRHALGALLLLTGAPVRASAQPVPGLLLERAIKAAGGAAALEHTARLAWDGDATVHAGGRTVSITGTWRMALPDSASVATRPAGSPERDTRTVLVNGQNGWLVRHDTREVMAPALLASERDEFWAYQLMRLVPLRDRALVLRLIPGDSVEWKAIEVRGAGRPTAHLQFDERARLRSITMDVRDATGQGSHRQQFVLRGEQRIETPDGSARWFAALDIAQDGVPYFSLTARNVRRLPREESP